MFERDTITVAVDLQQGSYQLLRWMTDASRRGLRWGQTQLAQLARRPRRGALARERHVGG